MVRARFQCQRVEDVKYAGGASKNIVLTPITPYNSKETDENKAFWKYTPSGEIKMTGVTGSAVDEFVPGQHYYVDFTAIEPAQ